MDSHDMLASVTFLLSSNEICIYKNEKYNYSLLLVWFLMFSDLWEDIIVHLIRHDFCNKYIYTMIV